MAEGVNQILYNSRKITGPSNQIVRDTDDILNVDTTAGPVTLTLQNIRLSGALQNSRKILINDIGGQVSVNPITILPAGSDLVNSGVSVILNVDGCNAKATVANQNEWSVTGVGVVSSGISGGGTVNRIAKFTTPTAVGDSMLFDNGVGVGLGTVTPHVSAIFDITSTTKGILYPRMTTAQRNAIATPATSLIIFNTSDSQFQYYNGASWVSMDNNGIYGGSGVVPTNTTATLTDKLLITSPAGPINSQFGIGTDPFGWGYDGVMSYMYSTPATNLEGWGGLMNVSGEAAWWHEVYDVAGNTSGYFSGYSPVQTNPYASLYHYDVGTTTYRGFEANKFGEQLYSQRLALVTTALTSADRVLFVSNAGGYIKATTYADLRTQLNIPTLYSADATIASATRNVTINNTLNFLHGAAGVNGYFQLTSGGYFKAQTNQPSAYLEYNHFSNVLTITTDVHTVAGTRFVNQGGVGNPTSQVELFAGGNGTAQINIGTTTSRLDFYVNNTAKYAGGIIGGSAAYNGSWGFGTQPTTAAKVHIMGEAGQGAGTIIQSLNLSPAESILQVRDAANVTKFNVSATGITTVSDRLFAGYNLGSLVTGAAFAVKGSDSSFLSTQTELFDGSNNSLWKMMNNGNIGHNIAPNAMDRMYIRAGSGYDGAINISAFNLANNGYGILLQGGLGVAGTYNGIWSDANGGATVDNRAFFGNSSVSGAANNIAAEFRARNGSTTSIAVWGRNTGGDAVVPSFAAVGVQGSTESAVATNRRAGYFYSIGNVDNGITYGLKSEVDASGVNAVNYGLHARINGAGAGRVNHGIYLQVDGGGGATNYALVTNGGNVGFGTTTPSNQALLELVSTTQAFLVMRMTSAQASAITPSDGMMLYVTDTNGTFLVVGFWGYENGVWTKL